MDEFKSTIGILSPSLQGFLVSSIMLTGAAPAIFAGQLADKLGRLKVVLLGALVFMIGTVIEASAPNLTALFIGRALCGFGEGLWMSTVSV
jgi:MFS family permease